MTAVMQGVIAEHAFALKCLHHDLEPIWPTSPVNEFDLYVVAAGAIPVPVQVKSTKSWRSPIRVLVTRTGPHRGKGARNARYTPGRGLIIAVHLVLFDIWYLIPLEKAKANMKFYPDSPNDKWGEYREAWHLLKGEKK